MKIPVSIWTYDDMGVSLASGFCWSSFWIPGLLHVSIKYMYILLFFFFWLMLERKLTHSNPLRKKSVKMCLKLVLFFSAPKLPNLTCVWLRALLTVIYSFSIVSNMNHYYFYQTRLKSVLSMPFFRDRVIWMKTTSHF